MMVFLFSINCQDSACIPLEYPTTGAHGWASFLDITPEQVMHIFMFLMILALIFHIIIERSGHE